MKTCAIINQKGGVGKSTTSINLSAELASRGYRTLLIEMDRQCNSSKVISGGLKDDDFPLTMTDVFNKKNKATLADAIQKSDYDNLWYCPASSEFQVMIEECSSRINRESILEKQMKGLEQAFDIVIIDCSPALDLGTLNAMQTSDFYLVPLDGHEFAVEGLSGLLMVLYELKGVDVNLAVFRNEYDKKNTIANSAVQKELDNAIKYEVLTPDDVLKVQIRKREVVGHASSDRKPLLHYRPKSEVNDDYRALADAALERLNVVQL